MYRNPNIEGYICNPAHAIPKPGPLVYLKTLLGPPAFQTLAAYQPPDPDPDALLPLCYSPALRWAASMEWELGLGAGQGELPH